MFFCFVLFYFLYILAKFLSISSINYGILKSPAIIVVLSMFPFNLLVSYF